MYRTLATLLLMLTCGLSAPTSAAAQACGDPDADGVDVIDAANVARAAVGLPSTCAAASAICDLDGLNGIDADDAADVLRQAVGLAATRSCVPRLALTEVARGFDAPLFVGAAGGDPSRLYVVEQDGRIRLIKDGTVLSDAFLDISDLVSSGGERGLLGLAFHPSYATNGRLVRELHRPRRRHGDRRVPPLRRRSRPRGSRRGARLLHRRPTVREPQRRHARVRAGRLPLHRPRRRRQRRRSAGQRARTLDTQLGKILRIDVDAGPDARPPATRSRRGDRRHLGLRPAQPVALQLRPRAPATSTSATSARARSRRSTSEPRAAAGGTTAGASSRAPTASARRRAATSPASPRPSLEYGARRRLLRSSAATSIAARRFPRSPAATSTPTTARAASGRSCATAAR